MKYKIYQLVEPTQLDTVDNNGYTPSIQKHIALKEIDSPLMWEVTFNSLQDAENAIIQNKEKFIGIKLIIIPEISVSWDGKIN